MPGSAASSDYLTHTLRHSFAHTFCKTALTCGLSRDAGPCGHIHSTDLYTLNQEPSRVYLKTHPGLLRRKPKHEKVIMIVLVSVGVGGAVQHYTAILAVIH